MASLTLLQICEEAMEGTGITAPSAIVSGDDTAQQLLRLANTAGDFVAKAGDWQGLITEANFTVVDTDVQVTIASEWADIRKIIDNSMWNRTQQCRVHGPLSSQAWQRVKATSVAPARLFYRIRGGQILLIGNRIAADTIYFEYVSKNWVSNAAGNSFSNRFAVDTDFPRFDDKALMLELRWRFRAEKGLEYAEQMRDAQEYVAERLANDKPAETLNLSPGRFENDMLDGHVPEGNWNL